MHTLGFSGADDIFYWLSFPWISFFLSTPNSCIKWLSKIFHRVKAIVKSMDLGLYLLRALRCSGVIRSGFIGKVCMAGMPSCLWEFPFWLLCVVSSGSWIPHFQSSPSLITCEEATSLRLNGRGARFVFTVYTSVGLCFTPTWSRTWFWFTFSIELPFWILTVRTTA